MRIDTRGLTAVW